MEDGPSRRTMLATGGILATGLGGLAVAAQDRDEYDRSLEWGGLGGGPSGLSCPDAVGTWQWVLTPGGSTAIDTDAVLTVIFEDDTEVTVDGYRPGQGTGAVHFDLEKPGGGTVDSATAWFDGGGQNPNLTVGGRRCVERDEEAGDGDDDGEEGNDGDEQEDEENGDESEEEDGDEEENEDSDGEDEEENGDEDEEDEESGEDGDEDGEDGEEDEDEEGEEDEGDDEEDGEDGEEEADEDGEDEESGEDEGDEEESEDDGEEDGDEEEHGSGTSEIEVETASATDVDKSAATLHGELTSIGEFAELQVFFEWRPVTADSWSTTASQPLTQLGTFDREIDGLAGDTRYEFRAVASGGEAVATGDVRTFTTADDQKNKPDVESDVSLEATCYDDSTGVTRVRYLVTNETTHDLKFSWQLLDEADGGKVTVDAGEYTSFWVETDEISREISLYFDGVELATADGGSAPRCQST